MGIHRLEEPVDGELTAGQGIIVKRVRSGFAYTEGGEKRIIVEFDGAANGLSLPRREEVILNIPTALALIAMLKDEIEHLEGIND